MTDLAEMHRDKDSIPLIKPMHSAVKLFIRIVAGVGLVVVVYQGTVKYLAKQALLTAERTETACPTLFSVARTPRDTLLVMRSEPLCVGYIMKALK